MRQRFQKRSLLHDAVIVVTVTVIVSVVCVSLNINEALFHWSRDIEGLQLDELPMVLLTLTICLLWFSARRYREGNVLWQQQRATDARLTIALNENRRLAQQYLNSLESERKQLARELHDELGQYLNAIKLDVVAIRQSRSQSNYNEGEVQASATAIERSADHVYAVVAELIRQLRPVGLDELGLPAAVENLIDSWRQRLPIKIDYSVSGDFDALSEQANLTVFRVIQESLTNVAKHSQANRVTIQLSRTLQDTGPTVAIVIEDNGCGFDVSQSNSGFGLVGMRERVEMQGGRFDLIAAPNKGCRLNVVFPV